MRRLIDADAVKENHKRWIGYLDDDMIGRMNFAIDHHVPTVLTIPDNPTNGDMIQAILPRHWKWGTNGDFVHVWGDGQTMTFTFEWWKTQYKAESEDKECR